MALAARLYERARPARTAACEALAAVQPIVAVAPEFDRVRDQTVARPALRPRHPAGSGAAAETGDGGGERSMARHRRALLRRGDHDLLLARAAPPVAVGLGFAHALDASLDPYLANDSFPVEGERRARVR